jgi:hypothetical protein
MLGKLRVCLLLIAVAGSSESAAETSAAYLFRRCSAIPAAVAAADAVCANYVYSVLLELPFDQSDAALRRNTCYPPVLSPAQATAIIGNYLRNHPARVGAGAAIVRAEAFNAAFPCRPN